MSFKKFLDESAKRPVTVYGKTTSWQSYDGKNYHTRSDTRIEITKGTSAGGYVVSIKKKLSDKVFSDISPSYSSLKDAIKYAEGKLPLPK